MDSVIFYWFLESKQNLWTIKMLENSFVYVPEVLKSDPGASVSFITQCKKLHRYVQGSSPRPIR